VDFRVLFQADCICVINLMSCMLICCFVISTATEDLVICPRLFTVSWEAGISSFSCQNLEQTSQTSKNSLCLQLLLEYSRTLSTFLSNVVLTLNNAQVRDSPMCCIVEFIHFAQLGLFDVCFVVFLLNLCLVQYNQLSVNRLKYCL